MLKNIMNKTSNVVILILLTIIMANIFIVYSFFSLYSKENTSIVDFVADDRMYHSSMLIGTDNTEENTLKGDVLNDRIVEENCPTGNAEYYIRVNILAQTVTIYSKDENNRYSKPVKAMICSTGESTPEEGVYKITSYKREWLKLQGGVYGLYCSQIVGDILFHSVPYLEYNNHASLEYWEYDKLGTEASLGCVRLTVEDAKWIFNNCESGTMVEFYSDSISGPLGKPKAIKISEESEELRNWDPTDDKETNPWIEYRNLERKKEEEIIMEMKQELQKREITNIDIENLRKNSSAIQAIERAIDILGKK